MKRIKGQVRVEWTVCMPEGCEKDPVIDVVQKALPSKMTVRMGGGHLAEIAFRIPDPEEDGR